MEGLPRMVCRLQCLTGPKRLWSLCLPGSQGHFYERMVKHLCGPRVCAGIFSRHAQSGCRADMYSTQQHKGLLPLNADAPLLHTRQAIPVFMLERSSCLIGAAAWPAKRAGHAYCTLHAIMHSTLLPGFSLAT